MLCCPNDIDFSRYLFFAAAIRKIIVLGIRFGEYLVFSPLLDVNNGCPVFIWK